MSRRNLGARVLSVIALGFLGGNALAADVLPETPSWTGVYVGAGGGYQWGNFDVDTKSCFNVSSITDLSCNSLGNLGAIYSLDLNDSNWFATAQIGADYQVSNRFVVGAMFDIAGGQELSDSKFNDVDPGYGDQYWDVSVGSMLTLSARAGFLMTPEALVYGLVGWSWASAEAKAFEGCDFDGGGTPCNDTYDRNSETVNGLTVGGGLEWMAYKNMSLRVEYRYTDLGSIGTHDSSTVEDAGQLVLYNEVSTDTDINVQSVRMTLNYRF